MNGERCAWQLRVRLHLYARELLTVPANSPDWPEVKAALVRLSEIRRDIIRAGWFNAIIAAVLLSSAPAAAEIVLDARPTVRVVSGDEKTSRSVLSDAEGEKSRVTITRRGNRYFWTSREDRKLEHHIAGAFHYFVEPTGAGYVKVLDTHKLAASLRERGPRFLFMEHVSLWLSTITYWGSAEGFQPPSQ